MKVSGKQILESTITQEKVSLTTPNSGDTLSGATVDYVNLYGSGNNLTYSNSNLSMSASTTSSDGDLACSVAILDIPKSLVRVYVNGIEVTIGNGESCYFSNDNGVTAKDIGEETIGDYLYWNGSISGYQLSSVDGDIIDFIYLKNK
jgi:hypothetical protein